jgi:RecA/RadA recombinase
MSSLLERMKAAGSIKHAEVLSESTFFNEKDQSTTDIPIINIALSGMLDGGLTSGLTTICGPSKHFKSSVSLVLAAAYMKKYPEAICLFYDSEFGITPEYLTQFGIDTSRVIHIPIEHIEQLKFDIVKRLEEITRKDKVFILIDSVGNLASVKETQDAMDEKSVADMSRAKSLKSVFRIITPHLTTKDIPCVVINHIYMEQGLYPKAIVSGGTGVYLSADNIFILGRQQEKEGTEVTGYNFIINVEKSRYVREKSKIPVTVLHDGGINKWSGLLAIALESGHVIKPSNGWYSKVDLETGEVEEKKYREKDTDTKDFWIPILKQQSFNDFIENKYCVAHGDIMQEESEDEATE